MIVEALKTYERAVASDFGSGLHVSAVVLTLVGSAGMTWYLLTLALRVALVPSSRMRFLARGTMAVAIGLLGGLKEAAPILWSEAAPRAILWNANYIALLGIHVFAAVILFTGYKGIENLWMRSFVRSYLILLVVFIPLSAVQLVLHDISSTSGLPA